MAIKEESYADEVGGTNDEFVAEHGEDLKEIREGLHRIISNTHKQSFEQALMSLEKRIAVRISDLEKQLSSTEDPISSTLQAMEARIKTLETPAPKASPQVDTAMGYIDSLTKRMFSFEQQSSRLRQALVRQDKENLRRLKSGLKSGKPRSSSKPALAEIEILTKKILDLEKFRKPQEPKSLSFKPIMRMITRLEARLDSTEGKMKDFVPTNRLEEIDAREKLQMKREIDPLIESLEKRVRSSEQLATKNIEKVESLFTKSWSSLSKRIDKMESDMNDDLSEKEAEITKLSESESVLLRKMNAQFLKWLGCLEETAKKKTEASLGQLEKARKQIDSVKTEMLTRKDMEEFEESIIAPLNGIDDRISVRVKKEISALRKGLEEIYTKEIGMSLQKEIDREVEEKKSQQSREIEEELEEMIKSVKS